MNIPRANRQGTLTDRFRTVRTLIALYLTLSVATLAIAYLLRGDTSEVNTAVWIRGGIVAASAVVLHLSAGAASRGSHRAYRRLRVLASVMVVAIVVIVAVPGTFPLWMKIEQGICGFLLLYVLTILNGRTVRGQFASQ